MFRLDALPQVDPIEERRKVRAAVNQNVVSFVVVCAAIRIAPFFMKQMQLSF